MAEVPDYFQTMATWLSDNRERFRDDVQSAFGEPVAGRSLMSAYIDVWDEQLAAHAVVWENGMLDVSSASFASLRDNGYPLISEYLISDPVQLSPILERLFSDFFE